MNEKVHRVQVTRTCRYGHGDLVVDMNGDKPENWYLSSFRPIFLKSAENEGTSNGMALEDSSVVYTVQIYVCPTCGYTELFDDGKVYG